MSFGKRIREVSTIVERLIGDRDVDFHIEHLARHLRIVFVKGATKKIVMMAKTPSEYRGDLNMIARMKKAIRELEGC